MTTASGDRDFAGYRAGTPELSWPDGKRLAVSVVLNVEEGAELSVGMGDEANESVYEAVDPVVGQRDLCMESHFEYGTRAGWPRVRDVLGCHEVRVTCSASGRALAYSPWLAADARADGHEVSAHGWRWERHVHMDEVTERRVIERTVEAVTQACGAPPVGWHTRSAPSPNTRRLLVEQGGFLYDSDAYNDDLPYLVDVDGHQHVVMPYAFDTNDMRFHNGGGFVFAEDFARYCIAAFDRLYEEGGEAPRMLSVGLHLRIIGRAGRIAGLEQFLRHALTRHDVWFAPREVIAQSWRAGLGLAPWTPRRVPAADAS